jgi:maltooligosyltrehalose trehalohydrolase
MLMIPQIPMIFMGEEIGSRAPFLYFTDHGPELAKAVREGRQREFAAFIDVSHGLNVPDPNSRDSFETSYPERDAPQAAEWSSLYRELLQLRRRHITPFLKTTRSISARALNDKAVMANWSLSGKRSLVIAANLGSEPVRIDKPHGNLIWGMPSDALPPHTTWVWRTDA